MNIHQTPSTMIIPLPANEAPAEERIIRLLTDQFPMFGKESSKVWEESAPANVPWVLPARIPGLPHIVFIWPEPLEDLPECAWWNSQDSDGELKALSDNCKHSLVVETTFSSEDSLKQWKIQLQTALTLSADAPFIYDDSSMKVITRIEAEAIAELPIEPAIQDVYSFHTDYEEKQPDSLWAHTHGLSRLGAFEMDALNIQQHNREVCARLFALIVEKQLEKQQFDHTQIIISDNLEVQLIKLEDALSSDKEPDVFGRLSDRDDKHIENRAILLEQNNNVALSLLKNPGSDLSINNLLEQIKQEQSYLQSPKEAERTKNLAQYRWPIFCSLFKIRDQYNWEFLIQAQYSTTEKDLTERLWFKVSTFGDKAIKAILVNEANYMHEMKIGDDFEILQNNVCDWAISTEDGNYYPSNIISLASKSGIEVKSPDPVH